MPFYRQGAGGMELQTFAPHGECPETVVHLTREEQDRKRHMIAAHATQRRTLAPFSIEVERFRRAPRYDFTELPNQGRVLYEHHDWGLDGERWRALARAALRELGLGADR
jgi:LmbE family N-acetylglucosaminyl deacetylase